MTKRTDGPWEVVRTYDGTRVDGIGAVKAKTLLVMNNICCHATPEDYACMAAAPEMLEALKVAKQVLFNESAAENQPSLVKAWEQVCAAIAKAEGKE